ncbi:MULTISPECIES: trans-sulfuration enzyme family protein [Cupriavidus]|uniref:Cystathionine beta-lyase/cystathionine gamma-synthase n=2 Tax=Cupriavidus TaxID=106589 RepID=A0A7W4VGR2_9BURK|nr:MULTISPECIES: PLP-dependent transferase [Cupriavidus]MBB3011284.1 cystathionine beta-lyase/cystathionine gamma-synthase [Cupriavidus alkaliphilus]QBY56293.1 methionine gamma-lyase [Cupriavidus oxalaticus]
MNDPVTNLGSVCAEHAHARLQPLQTFIQVADYDALLARNGAPTATTGCHTPHKGSIAAAVSSTLAALEGAEAALLNSSGKDTLSVCLLTLLRSGDHIIAQRNHSPETKNFLTRVLPKVGVDVTLVDHRDTDAFRAAITPATTLIVLEAPRYPCFDITDLAAVSSLAREHGVLTLCDNTAATPLVQMPIALDIDLVVYRSSRYISGYLDTRVGIVAGSRTLVERVRAKSMNLGSADLPDAWLLLRGIQTLRDRVEQRCRNAYAMASFLEEHPKIERVFYPGNEDHPQRSLVLRQMDAFGGSLSFNLVGGHNAAERFVGALKLSSTCIGHSADALRVASPSYPIECSEAPFEFDIDDELGVDEGLVCMEVGVGETDRLLTRIEQALRHA